MNKRIITVSACLIAIFSSFMWVYSNTLQRNTDDVVKIRSLPNEDLTCKNNGGTPKYYDTGGFSHCDYSK